MGTIDPIEITTLVVGILLGAAGAALLALRAAKRRRCTATATSRVTGIRYPVYKTIEYAVGGQVYQRICKINRRHAFSLHEGDEEPVHYNPENPEDAFLAAPDAMQLWLGIGGIALALAALAAAFGLI